MILAGEGLSASNGTLLAILIVLGIICLVVWLVKHL